MHRQFPFCALSTVRHIVFALLLILSFDARLLIAQETAVKLIPAKSPIHFTLGATLHTVHGTFQMKSGEIRIDPVTGAASGSIVIDATSGSSDNSSRDHKMHKEILESAKYPEIAFSPREFMPQPGHTLRETLNEKGTTQLQANGLFRLHGQDHDVTLDLTVENEGNGQVEISGAFPVPYVKWGLKSPNTLVLRVSDTVQLEIRASGQIAPAQ